MSTYYDFNFNEKLDSISMIGILFLQCISIEYTINSMPKGCLKYTCKQLIISMAKTKKNVIEFISVIISLI